MSVAPVRGIARERERGMARARAIVPLVARLTLMSARNRWRRRLARLRRPRYALALLAGGAYLWMVLVQQGGAAQLGTIVNAVSAPLTALGLAILGATWWLAPDESRALAFTPAEAHFLFPAPVSRRALLVWKVLRAQGTIMLSTVLWVALLRGGGGTAGWMRAASLWALFSTMHLHRLGVQLAHVQARERTQRDRPWRPIVWGMLAVLTALVGSAIWAERAALRMAPDMGAIASVLARALEAPAARIALAPARIATAPLFAVTSGEWAGALAGALALLLLHYAWVLARDVAFEESAVAATSAVAEARGRRIRRGVPRATRGRWLSALLRPAGFPAVAIVWKNALGYARTLRLAPVLVAIVAFGALNVLASGGSLSVDEMLLPLALAMGVLLVLFGPSVVRVDLRQDLAHLETLRAWPLSGARVVGAEVAGAAAMLLLLQLAYGAIVALALAATGGFDMAPRELLIPALATVLVLAVVDLAHFALHNLVAVLFPDWVRPERERMGGVEATGQGMILIVVLLVALVLLLCIPAAAGLATLAVATTVVEAPPGPADRLAIVEAIVDGAGAGAWLGASMLFGALLLVETGLLVAWAGRALDRTEPADAR